MLLRSLKLRGKKLIIDAVSRSTGSHFIELNDVTPQNSFAISSTGVSKKEMQVGDLHACLLQIFFGFYHHQFFTQMSYLLTNCYNASININQGSDEFIQRFTAVC